MNEVRLWMVDKIRMSKIRYRDEDEMWRVQVLQFVGKKLVKGYRKKP